MKNRMKTYLSGLIITLVTSFGFVISTNALAVTYEVDLLEKQNGSLIICDNYIEPGVVWDATMFVNAAIGGDCGSKVTIYYVSRGVLMDYSGSAMAGIPASILNPLRESGIDINRTFNPVNRTFGGVTAKAPAAGSLSMTGYTYNFNDATDAARLATIKAAIEYDNPNAVVTLAWGSNDAPTARMIKVELAYGNELYDTNGSDWNNISVEQNCTALSPCTIDLVTLPNTLIYKIGDTVSLTGGIFEVDGIRVNNSSLKIVDTFLTSSTVSQGVSLEFTYNGEKIAESSDVYFINVTNNQDLASAKQAKVTELNNLVKNLIKDSYHADENATLGSWEHLQDALAAAIEAVYAIDDADSRVAVDKVNAFDKNEATYDALLDSLDGLKTKKAYDDALIRGFSPAGSYKTTLEAAKAIKDIQLTTAIVPGYNTLANTTITWNNAVATVKLNTGEVKINFINSIEQVNVAKAVLDFKAEVARPTNFLNQEYETYEEAAIATACEFWAMLPGGTYYEDLAGCILAWDDFDFPMFNVADHMIWNGMTLNVKLPNGDTLNIVFTNIEEYTIEQNHAKLAAAAKAGSTFLANTYDTQASAFAAIGALINPASVTKKTDWANDRALEITVTYAEGTSKDYKFIFTKITGVTNLLTADKTAADDALKANRNNPSLNFDVVVPTKAAAVSYILGGVNSTITEKDNITWNGMTATVKLNSGTTLTFPYTNITQVKNEKVLAEINALYVSAANNSGNILNNAHGNEAAAEIALQSLVNTYLGYFDITNSSHNTFVQSVVAYYKTASTFKANNVNKYILTAQLAKMTGAGELTVSADATALTFFKFTNITTLKTADDAIRNIGTSILNTPYPTVDSVKTLLDGITGAATLQAGTNAIVKANVFTIILNDGSAFTLTFPEIQEVKANQAINNSIIGLRNNVALTTTQRVIATPLSKALWTSADFLQWLEDDANYELPTGNTYDTAEIEAIDVKAGTNATTFIVTYKLMYDVTVSVTYTDVVTA